MALQAWDWGVSLVAGALWRELGLEQILDRRAKGRRGSSVALADRVLALVANRLEAPGSEHGLAGWLETSFVCDRHGRQWRPEWRDEAERRASATPRVRVGFRQLQRWYRTLDQLLVLKPTIEKELFLRLRDLFSLKVDLVLYDLTSTYFEGHGPARLGAHGYSRDGKPRQRQVLVGLVMVDGWPIAHHVFAGNDRDASTVPLSWPVTTANERFESHCMIGWSSSAIRDVIRSRDRSFPLCPAERAHGTRATSDRPHTGADKSNFEVADATSPAPPGRGSPMPARHQWR